MAKPPRSDVDETSLPQQASQEVGSDIRSIVRNAMQRAGSVAPSLSHKDAAEITRQARLTRKPS
jgi:hypothetical protein